MSETIDQRIAASDEYARTAAMLDRIHLLQAETHQARSEARAADCDANDYRAKLNGAQRDISTLKTEIETLKQAKDGAGVAVLACEDTIAKLKAEIESLKRSAEVHADDCEHLEICEYDEDND